MARLSGENILLELLMHSAKIISLMTSLFTVMHAGGALAQTTGPTHCHLGEKIQFSCRIGVKVVSLCAGGEAGAATSLAYRFGRIGKVENEFVARSSNENRFYATVMPANPRAAVKQIWFTRGEFRYLLTECVGGSCPQEGGLAVLRGYRILKNSRCEFEMENNLGTFSRELVYFDLSSTPWHVKSATDLLIVVEDDDHFEKLFPSPRGVLW